MIFQKSVVFLLALLFATIAMCEGGGGLAAATEPFQQRQRRFKASKNSKKNPPTLMQGPLPTPKSQKINLASPKHFVFLIFGRLVTLEK